MSTFESLRLPTVRVKIEVLEGQDPTGERVTSKGKSVKVKLLPQPGESKAVEQKG